MNFLRFLTKYYKNSLPSLTKTLIKLRDEVTVKECARFFADIKRQTPMRFNDLQPTINNYFR